jgi:acyl-[acyl-carrier-protein]-phospholipid O-acyltransferase / long-chain-fatty-acid--[acyl-carrier-protein] ligase
MAFVKRIVRGLLETLAHVLVRILFPTKVEGLEKLDLSKPTIIMPNHVSLIDAVLLGFVLPRQVTFVVNTQIAQKFSWLVQFRKHITVDPLNPYSVRQMVRGIQQGAPLVIFPEGRISVTGGLMKMYPGAAYIALKTGAQVIPVTIRGAERSKFIYIGRKVETHWRVPIGIRIGEPFSLKGRPGESIRERKQAAADTILRVLQEQLFWHRMKPEVQLFDELVEAARWNNPKRIAVQDYDTTLTYRKLLIGCYALARKLGPLLRKEARVGLLLPTAIGHVVALFSLLRLGKSPAILNFTAGRSNVEDACETAELRTVLTSRVFVEKANLSLMVQALERKVRVIYLEDLRSQVGAAEKLGALLDYVFKRKAANAGHLSEGSGEVILFTSGSESKPKGVVLGHENIFANIQQVRSVIDFTSDDKLLNALPMFHSFGLTAGTLLPLLSGIPVFLYPSPLHYKVIPELSYQSRATVILGTSTFLAGYGRQAHPYDFFSARLVVAGGEKLKEDVRQLWLEKFGLRILEGYGVTETAPILSLNTPMSYKRSTVGRMLPGIDHMIEQVEGIEEGGNLLVRGPNVMRGYLLHGQGFVPAPEWYVTGDVVTIDEGGYVQIRSRLKRFAKLGGEMVSLNRIEELAAQAFPQSRGGFAAVSAADARKGERVVLFTTDPAVQRDTLSAALAANGHSSLWLPSKIIHLEKLPVLGSGKTDYVTLKGMCS